MNIVGTNHITASTGRAQVVCCKSLEHSVEASRTAQQPGSCMKVTNT